MRSLAKLALARCGLRIAIREVELKSETMTMMSMVSIRSFSSPTYTERKLFAYPPHQVFDVVADVQHYDQFVPWCVRSTVLRVGGGGGSGSGGSGSEGASETSVEEGSGQRQRQQQQQQTTAEEARASSPHSSPPCCTGSLDMEAELEIGFRNFSER